MRDALRAARIAAGLTQREIAERALISRSHYSQIESGRKAPSFCVAVRLKRAVNKKYDSLFDVNAASEPVVGAPRKD